MDPEKVKVYGYLKGYLDKTARFLQKSAVAFSPPSRKDRMAQKTREAKIRRPGAWDIIKDVPKAWWHGSDQPDQAFGRHPKLDQMAVQRSAAAATAARAAARAEEANAAAEAEARKNRLRVVPSPLPPLGQQGESLDGFQEPAVPLNFQLPPPEPPARPVDPDIQRLQALAPGTYSPDVPRGPDFASSPALVRGAPQSMERPTPSFLNPGQPGWGPRDVAWTAAAPKPADKDPYAHYDTLGITRPEPSPQAQADLAKKNQADLVRNNQVALDKQRRDQVSDLETLRRSGRDAATSVASFGTTPHAPPPPPPPTPTPGPPVSPTAGPLDGTPPPPPPPPTPPVPLPQRFPPNAQVPPQQQPAAAAPAAPAAAAPAAPAAPATAAPTGRGGDPRWQQEQSHYDKFNKRLQGHLAKGGNISDKAYQKYTKSGRPEWMEEGLYKDFKQQYRRQKAVENNKDWARYIQKGTGRYADYNIPESVVKKQPYGMSNDLWNSLRERYTYQNDPEGYAKQFGDLAERGGQTMRAQMSNDLSPGGIMGSGRRSARDEKLMEDLKTRTRQQREELGNRRAGKWSQLPGERRRGHLS